MNKKKLVIIVAAVVAAVVVAVVLDAMLGNHNPTITSLIAEPAIVPPSKSTQIACLAADQDGDELEYNWSASGGMLEGEGDIVTWFAPCRPLGDYTITVKVSDGRGGRAKRTTTVQVIANKPPEIHGLTADPVWTLPLGSVNVACVASDPQNDELSYDWSAIGGSITGAGPETLWTAPQETGVYNITVVVSDGYGGSDTRTVPVSVVTGQPPTIEDLVITKERYGHCYLKPYSGGYYVGQERMYDIECIVAQAGIELFYEWSCTGGVLFGEGALVTWTAPDKSDKVAITVTVSDVAGNMASKNLVLKVASCSVCIFGYCTG